MRALAFSGGRHNICSIKMSASPQPVPRRRTRQLGLQFRTWGGKRAGAGRKPRSARAGVAHRARGEWTRPVPLHVTLRMAPHVYHLRSRRSFRVIAASLRIGGDRFNVRVIQFSVQGNHIHLVVEAPNGPGSRARPRDPGLSIRVAKGLNRMMGRTGRSATPSTTSWATRASTPPSAARPMRPATSIRTRRRARPTWRCRRPRPGCYAPGGCVQSAAPVGGRPIWPSKIGLVFARARGRAGRSTKSSAATRAEARPGG